MDARSSAVQGSEEGTSGKGSSSSGGGGGGGLKLCRGGCDPSPKSAVPWSVIAWLAQGEEGGESDKGRRSEAKRGKAMLSVV